MISVFEWWGACSQLVLSVYVDTPALTDERREESLSYMMYGGTVHSHSSVASQQSYRRSADTEE